MAYPGLALTLLLAAATGMQALAAPQNVAAAPIPRPGQITATAPLFRSVRLIGASATDGFGNASELKTDTNVPFASFLSACLSDANAGAVIEERGSSQFFLAPTVIGAQQAAWARAGEPTLVIAFDFLFWYGCGFDRPEDPRRLIGLEKGLAELEGFTCPLVIGTIPDVTHALRGKGPFGGPMIHRYQIPSEEDRLAMNQRILEWASGRKDVVVLDVAALFHSVVAREEITIRDQTWKIGELTDVLQADFLHANLDGTLMTALCLADTIARLDGASEEDFVFKTTAVKERFLGQIAPLRAKHAERMARRATRGAQRELAHDE